MALEAAVVGEVTVEMETTEVMVEVDMEVVYMLIREPLYWKAIPSAAIRLPGEQEAPAVWEVMARLGLMEQMAGPVERGMEETPKVEVGQEVEEDRVVTVARVAMVAPVDQEAAVACTSMVVRSH